MARVTDIRQALAANLAVAFQPGYEVSAYMLAAAQPKSFQIFPDRVDFHQTLQDGMELQRYVVGAFVGYASAVETQQALDLLLDDPQDVSDPLSVRAALEADQALTKRLQDDGTVVTGQPSAADDVTVAACSGYKIYTLQGGQQLMLGAEWTVEVRT